MPMVASLPFSLCSIDCVVGEKAEKRTPSTQSELQAQPLGSARLHSFKYSFWEWECA